MERLWKNAGATGRKPGARQALESVAATIDDSNTLTTGERTLMRELLARLADD